MIRIIILLLLSNVRSEKSVYLLKTESGYVQPIQRGYVYSQINNEPAKTITINNLKLEESSTKPLSGIATCDFKSEVINELCKRRKGFVEEKAKIDDGVSKNKDKKVQDVKATASELNNMYSDGGFHVDEEDLRTDNRYIYEDWPYMYHTPYDYEKVKFKTEFENDKSRSMHGNEKVIPVYEHVDDYRPPILPNNHIIGNKPILLHAPNYMDKVINEDLLTFKGMTWETEKDLHHNKPFINMEAQNSHLNIGPSGIYNIAMTNTAPKYVQSNKDHGYNKNEFGNHHKSNEEKNTQGLKSKYDAEKYNGYKDFLDTFANKFGAEDNYKNSKYMLKMNADKGEKKNGFRRVYHKDEYQEDNEFFDNTNKKSAMEQDGASKMHSGGSEAFLKSHAAAVLGEEKDSLSKHKDHLMNNYEGNNEGSHYNKGRSNDYNRYIDQTRHPAYYDPLLYKTHYGR